MRIKQIREQLESLGAKSCHLKAIYRAWSQSLPLGTKYLRPEDFLPLAVREALPALMGQLEGLVQLRSSHPSEDSSTRLLVELNDGQMVESVLLPRGGLCISTQVGCAVGCLFCMTGRSGLLRQVTSGEMVAQVALARRQRAVKKVVFMGMGEPAHNMDNVLETIELLGSDGDIGHKNLVFSTVGDKRVFEQLPLGPVKPALAISLHTTNSELRAKLLPNAPRIEIEELVELADAYARSTRYPIQYQWTLLSGINDTDEELEGLARLLAGKYAVLNFINYNANEGVEYQRTPWERADEMSRYLFQHGVICKLRRSAGQDVDGGCGQLRARAQVERTKTVRVVAPSVVSSAAAK